jgi:hypothetical protein
MMLDPLHDLEEQCASRVLKPLVLTCVGERLAWKARTQNVKLRNLCDVNLVHVSVWLDSIVGLVRSSCGGIDVAREHALKAVLCERVMKATNPTTNVNEGDHCNNALFLREVRFRFRNLKTDLCNS